jgi:hypothetical protein
MKVGLHQERKPLFINNLSGKMRLKAQVEEASDTAMEPPACNVVVIAYRS